jgi:SAM-dependent methyltransferase
MIPRFVRWQSALGRGDLHPGGRAVSERLGEWCERWRGGTLVEIGAGAGLTSARYAARGWNVIATEPDPVLSDACRARGLTTLRIDAEALPGTLGEGAAAVVLSESVLFALDLPRALAAIARTLAPGGALALTEMVWTDLAPEEQARALHDASAEAFGIAVASRARWTWADWSAMLDTAGFDVERSERLPDGSGMTRTLSRTEEWSAMLRNPRAALGLRMFRTAPVPRVPDDWFESWAALAVKR